MKKAIKFRKKLLKIWLNIRLSVIHERMYFELIAKLGLIMWDLLVHSTGSMLNLIDEDTAQPRSKLGGREELSGMSERQKNVRN